MRRKSIAYLMAIVMLVTTFAFQFSAFAATDSSIKVQFQNGNNSASSNTIAGTYNVTNTGSSPLDLSTLKLKYYYTKDADKAQNFWCDHSGYMSGWNYIDVTSKVKGTFTSVSGSSAADTCLEITFASGAGNLPAGGSITIQTRVARTDWSNYDQSNDYSYKQSGSLVDWDHIVAYVNGTLAYGVEIGTIQEHNPKISPESATFDLDNPSDITVTLTPDGATFNSISGLTKDTDYKVSGNTVTISKSKLATYAEGTTQTFTFDFGVSKKPVLTVSIVKGGSKGLKATIGTASGKTGDTVVVPVTLADVAKAGKVGTFGFNINYDKSLLEAVKVEAGDVVVNPSVNFSSQINAGSISFLFLDNTIGSELIEKDGVIANITFKILGTSSTTTPLTFKDGAVFGDANMAKIKDVKLTNGSVEIGPGPIPEALSATIGTASGKAGDTVVIPVTLANVAKAGKVGTFGFNINYDKSLLEAVKVEAGDVVVNPSVNFSSQINAGSISFLFLDNTIGSELIEKDGVVANITFKILGTAETKTAVTFKDGAVFGDASMAKIAKVTLTNGSVSIGPGPSPEALSATIGTVTGKAGDTVVVPVTLANVAKAGKVGTFGFSINYDKSLLEAVKVEAGDVVVNPSVNFSSQINAGSISFLFLDNTIGSELIEKDGVIANITFKVIGTTETTVPLTFKDGAVFGDASMAKISKVTLTNGSVKIGSVPTPDAFSATIGTGSGKAGDTVVVPVTLANVATAGKVGTFGFNVNYDKSLLEAVKVEAGDVVVNPSVNFSSQINAGSISFLFLDNTIGSELIDKDGVVANITFKVLGTSETTTALTFKDGAVFGDASMAKIKDAKLVNGSVAIVPTTPEVKDPTISPTTATIIESSSTSDLTVALTPNGNTFTGITGLTKGTDYTVSGDTVVILKSYLNSLSKGAKVLIFDFNGKTVKLTITVEPKPYGSFAAAIGKATGKTGETVTIPVTFKDIAAAGKIGTFGFNVNYDKSILEAVKVEAGDIIVNPAVNFSSQINAGSISFLFLDNTIGNELIEKDGVVANITFKVLGTSDVTTPVSFKDGAVFGDASMAKISQVGLTNGSVTVVPVIPEPKDPTIDPSTAKFVEGSASDIAVAVTANGNTFAGITGLTKGTDYTVSGDTVTISKSYLNGLAAGTKALTFDFGTASATLTLTITPKQVEIKGLGVTIGTAAGKAGETITIPVTLKNVEKAGKVGTFGFTLNYDSTLLEASKVEAGSIVISPSVNFSSQIKAGSVTFLFLDNTIGDQLITSDGVVANITFKVLGSSSVSAPITFKDGAVFGDANMSKISDVTLTAGSAKLN